MTQWPQNDRYLEYALHLTQMLLYTRGSQPFSYHVPLQHSDRWACTPTAFQQISTYPFSISTDAHVPLIFPMTIHFIMIIHRYCIFSNKHTTTFQKNFHWYMCKYLEMNYIQIYFALLLITLNVPLRIGKCIPEGTCIPVWEPLL